MSSERGILRVPDGRVVAPRGAGRAARGRAARPHARWRRRRVSACSITGGGPIGALSVAAARARGVTDIVVSEPHPKRRALVEALGAVAVEPDELVTPPSPNDIVDDAVRRRARVLGTPGGDGSRARRSSAAPARWCSSAPGIKRPRFDNNRILLNELTITGSFVYDADGFERALELLADARTSRATC